MIRRDGQIYYPVTEFPDAPWMPEYAGNLLLVNGKLLPYLEVQPRKYRFRVLNASNGRFFFCLWTMARRSGRSERTRDSWRRLFRWIGLRWRPGSARMSWWISPNIAASAFS